MHDTLSHLDGSVAVGEREATKQRNKYKSNILFIYTVSQLFPFIIAAHDHFAFISICLHSNSQVLNWSCSLIISSYDSIGCKFQIAPNGQQSNKHTVQILCIHRYWHCWIKLKSFCSHWKSLSPVPTPIINWHLRRNFTWAFPIHQSSPHTPHLAFENNLGTTASFLENGIPRGAAMLRSGCKMFCSVPHRASNPPKRLKESVVCLIFPAFRIVYYLLVWCSTMEQYCVVQLLLFCCCHCGFCPYYLM